jgi:hypothetical protein
MFVVCGVGSQGEATGAQARAPSAEPVVHANPAAKPNLICRVCWVTASPATGRSRASAKPTILTLRRQVECDDCDAMVAWARSAGGVWSLATKCQTTLRCATVSESGQFASAAPQSCPVSRLLAGVACTHRAGRSLAAYCGVRGDMRSIAPLLPVMVGRSLATFGGVPGVRPNRVGSLVGLGWLARTSGPQRRPPERRD